ncbi:unnamed protein product [Rotaria sp. Silwood1]|nr:unnamed protein product [Rotaria sp. Silwood1]CAF3481170.1 unnamed protein product [Rotaria sp. Silwood1]CAF4528935.1 unnamed protein product [Rotaria sp. Silwood1]CAF4668602.1 unnamed protein product [Rotaria sp. Silwood1]
MSTNKEHIFVVGASGAIGSGIVRGLVKQGFNTTAYVRDESKAKNLFKDELLTECLTIVVGTYASVEVYEKAIEGHTRLFLLAVGDYKRPTRMSEVKETFAKIAYEKGVRQIVDLSSFTVRSVGRQGIIGYMHTTSEEKLWKLADERPDERSLVILRPGVFMSNQLMADIQSVKHSNKLVSCGSPSSTFAWIDTKDISDCSVVILTEPVEKHDRCVYEMGAEYLTHEQRAAVFTKVLGRPITYEQQPAEALYKMFIGFGLSHSYAYDLVSFPIESIAGHVTPQLSILIHRPLRTLEEWLQENVKAFQ